MGLPLPEARLKDLDALVFPQTLPFHRQIPAGNYPVELTVARDDDGDGDERVAFAVVSFGDAEAKEWVPAFIGNEGKLHQGELPAYGVDAGIGCFMDAETSVEFNRRNENKDY